MGKLAPRVYGFEPLSTHKSLVEVFNSNIIYSTYFTFTYSHQERTERSNGQDVTFPSTFSNFIGKKNS